MVGGGRGRRLTVLIMARLLITGDFKVSLCSPPRYLGLSVCQAVREQLKMIYLGDYGGQCVIAHVMPWRDRSDTGATFQDQRSNAFLLLEGMESSVVTSV